MEQTAVEWLVQQLRLDWHLEHRDLHLVNQAKEMEEKQKGYSEEEVIKLLISCKDRFGGSDLDDYTHDNEVKKWFEQFKKK